MNETMIQAALDALPSTCQQKSVSGGRHAYIRVKGDHPGGSVKLAQHPPSEDGGHPVLLAERRGHGAYAVITGPGRPPLASDFAPAELTREEYDEVEGMIRAAGTYTPAPPAKKPDRRTGGGGGTGGGTGEIITDGVRSGDVSPISVLPAGYEVTHCDKDGRTYFRRPGSGSEQSGNIFGGIVVIHSTAVTWAEPGQPMSAAECLARARFAGDFAAAMRWVEDKAKGVFERGQDPPEGWDRDVLVEIHKARVRKGRGARVRKGKGYGNQNLEEGSLKSAALGRRMARDWAGHYIFVPALGWHKWDGSRWNLHGQDEIVAETATWAEDFIIDLIKQRAPRAVIDAALRYREVGNVKSLVEGAKTALALLVNADRLDQHPTLLNCPNGVVDLTTGDLHAGDPDLLMTKTTGVDYEPGFTHPDWDTALAALDDEPRAFLQRRLGQALYGEPPPDDQLLLCDGGGQNGKTSVLGTVRLAVGEYGVMVSERILLGNVDQHPTEFMDFRGARFAYMEETPEARRLDVTRLKRIVGTPTIKARRMHKDPVEFPVTHTLFISTNYRPVVDEVDHGTWRRLLRVSFPYTFHKTPANVLGPRDRLGQDGLRQRLGKPGSDGQKAALAWMVQGAVEHHAAGGLFPTPPSAVLEATREWRREADLVMAYFEERLIPDPKSCVLATDLLDDFNAWLSSHHHRPWSSQTLATRFGGHSHTTRPTALRNARVETLPAYLTLRCITLSATTERLGKQQYGVGSATAREEDDAPC